MRAWLIDEQDDNGAMTLAEIDTPAPGPQQVRVDVRAIGVNRADLMQRQGRYPPPPGFDPRRPGLEYAGEVAAVGSDCHSARVGDPVMGLIGGGAYAEHIIVHERETIRVPEGFDFCAAAAMPEAFATAYRALFVEGGLQAGQWALIRGATSGVGQAALQLIAALGGRSIATSRSPARLDALSDRFAGAGRGAAFDLAFEDAEHGVAEAVTKATGGAHVVVDFVGAPVLADNLAALRAEGCQVQVGVIGGTRSEIDMGQLLGRRLQIKAMTMRSLPLERKIATARNFEERLCPLFETDRLLPLVDRAFAFDDAPVAHAAMAGGKHLGKLVLTR